MLQHIIRNIKKNTPNYVFFCIFVVLLTLTALANAFQHYYIDAATQQTKTLRYQIVFNLSLWLWWAFIYPFLYYVSVQIKQKNRFFSHWAVYIILVPVSIFLLHQTLATVIRYQFPVPMDFYTLLISRVFRYLSLWVDMSVYAVMMIAFYLLDYQRTYQSDELKLARLQSEYVQSRLHALKSQLHPHFLFNTLNTLSTLILKGDNSEAERMIELLKGFLQTTLNESNKLEATLSDELQYIRQYLEIEKVRFADKLTVHEDIKPNTLLVNVPSFILQPIVENSIYHAIAKRISDGHIHISARIRQNKLCICIEDNGPGNRNGTIKIDKEGIGLKVTKDRLRYLFGNNYQLVSTQTEEGGLSVQITMPQNSQLN